MGKKSQQQHESGRTQNKPKRADDFESVAKRLECDPDKASFEAKLGKLAKAKNPTKER